MNFPEELTVLDNIDTTDITHPYDISVIKNHYTTGLNKLKMENAMYELKMQSMKPGSTKKLQLRGYRQYKDLVKIIEDRNIPVRFELVFSDTQTRNKVVNITKSEYSTGHQMSGGIHGAWPRFNTEKIPVMYLRVRREAQH